MSVGSFVKALVAKAEADAEKVKAALLKAMNEIDGVVLPEAAVIEPAVAQLAGQITPGGTAIVNTAYAMLETVAKYLDTAGAAAEANLTNVGLDSNLIAQTKALIPAIKQAATQAKAA